MTLRALSCLLALTATAVLAIAEETPKTPVLAIDSPIASDPDLDAALDAIAPELKKWAAVCVIEKNEDGSPRFEWFGYRDTARKLDFWPASTIKLYTAVAGLELLTDHGFPLETIVQFEHREGDRWVLDCARTMPEMLSEVFRRSSNEDYTLLLRMVGIDRINSALLIPTRGFPSSALMRGYVLPRPHCFKRAEAQRITLRTPDGMRSQVLEHSFSGRLYSEERGCTIIDPKSGNVTSPWELGECLRRVLFHEQLPEQDRYRLTAEQLTNLRNGADGRIGLETKGEESGPSAWDGLKEQFPMARFYHKCGVISNYALEVAALDDSANSGVHFILVPVINAGEVTKPLDGEKLVARMAAAIGDWVAKKRAK
jgi:hypothetical protein